MIFKTEKIGEEQYEPPPISQSTSYAIYPPWYDVTGSSTAHQYRIILASLYEIIPTPSELPPYHSPPQQTREKAQKCSLFPQEFPFRNHLSPTPSLSTTRSCQDLDPFESGIKSLCFFKNEIFISVARNHNSTFCVFLKSVLALLLLDLYKEFIGSPLLIGILKKKEHDKQSRMCNLFTSLEKEFCLTQQHQRTKQAFRIFLTMYLTKNSNNFILQFLKDSNSVVVLSQRRSLLKMKFLRLC